jgi:nascent polypeptide-associated complex subunit beta
MNKEKLMKMAGAVRTGGKGTVRRKKKAVHKTTSTDDKRLQNTLKRLGVNTIPGIEEVHLYQGDSLISFTNPKVQASIAANTYVVSGPSTTKKVPTGANMGGGFPSMPTATGAGATTIEGADDDEDDDVPDLVENFDNNQ